MYGEGCSISLEEDSHEQEKAYLEAVSVLWVRGRVSGSQAMERRCSAEHVACLLQLLRCAGRAAAVERSQASPAMLN